MIDMIPPQVHFTDQIWKSDPERWSSRDLYKASCLLDGQLPIREPDGRFNVLAMQQAARELQQMSGNIHMRIMAARQLVRLFRLAHLPAPQTLIKLASSKSLKN